MSQSHIVAVYEVDRRFGGPEEGGWWYDAGQLAKIVKVFRSEDLSRAYCRRLNARLRSRSIGPNAGRRELSSVLSEGVVCACVYEDQAPDHFPETRPRYE